MTYETTFAVMSVAFSIATLFLVALSLRSVIFLKRSPIMKAVSLLLVGYIVGISGMISDNILTSFAPNMISNEMVQSLILMLPAGLMFIIAGVAYLQLNGFIRAEGK